MVIKDLRSGMGNVNLVLEIIEKGNIREFDKFGKKGKVCNAKAKDETGTVTLTLWNDDTEKVKVGDKLKMTNGYVSEYQGELQLGTGKFGKLEILDKEEEELFDEKKKLDKVKVDLEDQEKAELDDLGNEIKELDKEFEEDDEVYANDTDEEEVK